MSVVTTFGSHKSVASHRRSPAHEMKIASHDDGVGVTFGSRKAAPKHKIAHVVKREIEQAVEESPRPMRKRIVKRTPVAAASRIYIDGNDLVVRIPIAGKPRLSQRGSKIFAELGSWMDSGITTHDGHPIKVSPVYAVISKKVRGEEEDEG